MILAEHEETEALLDLSWGSIGIGDPLHPHRLRIESPTPRHQCSKYKPLVPPTISEFSFIDGEMPNLLLPSWDQFSPKVNAETLHFA